MQSARVQPISKSGKCGDVYLLPTMPAAANPLGSPGFVGRDAEILVDMHIARHPLPGPQANQLAADRLPRSPQFYIRQYIASA